MPAELLELVGEKRGPPEGETESSDNEECRKNPTDATSVERRDAESLVNKILEDDPRDQKPGDDKKHVDADVATGHICRKGMKRQDGEYGDAAQSVDVRAIRRRR